MSKTDREKEADKFVEWSEYDSEVSREMFLMGWDACAKNMLVKLFQKELERQEKETVTL